MNRILFGFSLTLLAMVFAGADFVDGGATTMVNQGITGLSVNHLGLLEHAGQRLKPRRGDVPGAPVGACWYDSLRKAYRQRSDFGIGGVPLVLAPSVEDSDEIRNPKGITSFSTKIVLPAGSLSAGKALKVTAFGRYATGAALSPTLELGLTLNAAALLTSGAVSSAINLKDQAWRVEALLVVRSVGSAGSLVGSVRSEIGGLLAAAAPVSQVGRAGATTIDTTAANTIAPAAKFGAPSASNAITCEALLAEVLN